MTLGRLTTSLSSVWRVESLVWVCCGRVLLSGHSCSLCSGEPWRGTLAFPAAVGDPKTPPMGIRRQMSLQCTCSVQPVDTLPGPGGPVGTPPSGAALGGSPEAQGYQRQGHLPSALLGKWGPWGCVHACVHVNMCSRVCGCACVYRGGMCTHVSIRACVFYVYPCVYVSVHVYVWHV